MKSQINSTIRILLGLIAGASASFLQAPSDQFESKFNSTFLTDHGKLNGPIVIPNITEVSKHSHAPRHDPQKIETAENALLKDILHAKLSQESSDEETDLREGFRPSENRFSSRYSSEEETFTESTDSEKRNEEKATPITDIPVLLERGEPISSKISLPSPPSANSFSDRSDAVDESEEEKVDGRHYPDSSEAREREESEIAFTTNEPYSELRTPSSIRTSPDDHLGNYETSSGVADESDESEKEDDSEEKRSLDDYHNSGSKNYHSIQTPLSKIKYRDPHNFGDDFDEDKTRERTPNRLRLIKHNWPYTRGQLKTEVEENEISDEEENEKSESEEWGSREELRTPKTRTKESGLEEAIRKDEIRFNRTRARNHIDDRRRRKEQEKNLAEEEEKDHESPYYETLKQYTANEEEPKYFPAAEIAKAPKKKHFEKSSTAPPQKTPKNIFFNHKPAKPSNANDSKELALDFPVHRFLGPIVFDEQNPKSPTTTKPYHKIAKAYDVPYRKYVKDLEEKEKLDQERTTNQRFPKIFTDKEARSQSFNHLEESDEMYNAILANIQSVFGLRTQPLRGGNRQNNHPEVNLEESGALTWSVPLIKRQIKPHQGVLESVTLGGSDGKVKSGSEGGPARKKSIFPTDIGQPRGEQNWKHNKKI